MRWLDGITSSRCMGLSKLRELVRDRDEGRGKIKRLIKLWRVKIDMFSILIVVMVSQMITFVKTYQIVYFKYMYFVYVKKKTLVLWPPDAKSWLI